MLLAKEKNHLTTKQMHGECTKQKKAANNNMNNFEFWFLISDWNRNWNDTVFLKPQQEHQFIISSLLFLMDFEFNVQAQMDGREWMNEWSDWYFWSQRFSKIYLNRNHLILIGQKLNFKEKSLVLSEVKKKIEKCPKIDATNKIQSLSKIITIKLLLMMIKRPNESAI